MSWSASVRQEEEEALSKMHNVQINEDHEQQHTPGGFGRGRRMIQPTSPVVNGGPKPPVDFSFNLNNQNDQRATDHSGENSRPQKQHFLSFGGGSGSTFGGTPSKTPQSTFGSPFGGSTNSSSFGGASFGSLGGGTKTPNYAAGEAVKSNASASSQDKWEQNEDEDKAMTKEEESILNKIVHDKLVQIKELNINMNKCNRKDLNPNSPLWSVKSFEELRLRKELLEGISSMGYSYPSKIQEATLPVLLADPPQNIIAQSQSGTGKTAAFVLTMLSRVKPADHFPQCLCLAPTYELALQIGKTVETMGKFCPDIKVTYAIRGHRKVSRNTRIEEHIIIGTPGTALDWILKHHCFDPKNIRVFVLDEADVMISQQGHQDQSIRIQKTLTDDCQRLFFSATYDDDVIEFAGKIVPDPIIYTVRKEDLPLDNVKQYYVECPSKDDKFRALSDLYGSLTLGQSMIFCHTKKIASWLASEMQKDNHSVAILSSELAIEQRAAVINRFKNAQERCLICTNVCARGIDVEQVTVVVNFDLPVTVSRAPDYETYLHRIGRTGRFGKSGLAINFVDGPRSREILLQIEQYFDMKIEKLDTTDAQALSRIESETC